MDGRLVHLDGCERAPRCVEADWMPIMGIVNICRGCHSVKAMLKRLGTKPFAVEVGELGFFNVEHLLDE